MLAAMITGLLLGASAGLSPGPMLALVLAQTLRHGPREGCKVALTPLVTDAPIILLVLVLAARLAQFQPMLGAMSVLGGVFILYLAWESLKATHREPGAPAERPRSWLKGITTNLLNPHPWVFWLTAGAAMLAKTLQEGWQTLGIFLAAFYAMLVGSKLAVALLAGRYRNVLSGSGYRVTMRVLAAMLALFGLLLLGDGLRHLASGRGPVA